MNDIQTRLEIQAATQQWVATFMTQYNIPAAMMEDALNKVLVTLKEQIVIDLLSAAAAPREEENNDTVESGDIA